MIDDLNTVQRALASMSPELLGRFITLAGLPNEIVLVGGGSLEPALTAAGKAVVRSLEEPQTLSDDAHIVFDGPAFDVPGYGTADRLRRRFPGRVTTSFNLLSGASLFQSVHELVGFHSKSHEKLLDILGGERPDWAGLGALDKLYPISGKRVLEYGPLDGAMTAVLLQHGATEVACVEIRLVNVIKILMEKHVFGWGERVKLLIEDMHMVDANLVGRFDLVIASGTYYHSGDPFRFLRNLTTLSDAIFVGGFCADPKRLRNPLVELRDGEDVYRAQPYSDKLGNDGGGAHATGYYFLPEDLLLFMERQGYTNTIIKEWETPANRNAGHYLQFLSRKNA